MPHLLGERSPYWNPAAGAVFAGLARHHGPAHLTRAVLEGVAFNLLTGLRTPATDRPTPSSWMPTVASNHGSITTPPIRAIRQQITTIDRT